MRIVEPSYEIWGPCPLNFRDGIKWIERAGRVCYQSESKEDSALEFCKKIVNRKHLSVLEHSLFVAHSEKLISPWQTKMDLHAAFGPDLKYLNTTVFNDRVWVGGNVRAWTELLSFADNLKIYTTFPWMASQFAAEWGGLIDIEPVTKYEYLDLSVSKWPKRGLDRVTVSFTVDRGVTHELVRHRPVSYCLSGDTEVVAYSSKKRSSPRRWIVRDLFNWQSDPQRKGRLKLIRLRCVDENLIIKPGRIKRIINSGVKTTYEVVSKSGRKIKTTLQHRFLTEHGWKALKDIKIGDRLAANGTPALDNKEWLYAKYILENNTLEEMAGLVGCCVSYITRALRKHGINKELSQRKNRKPGRGKPGVLTESQKQAISERMTGAGNHRWKGEQASSNAGYSRTSRRYTPDVCWGCQSTEKLERHHIDKNPKNTDSANILFLCQMCHKSFHLGAAVHTTFWDEVISITKTGEEETYDIEMDGPHHNFVAEGVVVHNSQSSTRYCNYSQDKFGNEISVIQPPGLSYAATRAWRSACMIAEESYMTMLNNGCSAEIARSVLPTCLATTIVVTADLAEWNWIFHLRCSKAAHPQIREVMEPLRDEFKARGWV